MPRLPTIRVIGSHAISTRFPLALVLVGTCVLPLARSSQICRWVDRVGLLPLSAVAGEQLLSLRAPLGLGVDGLGRDIAQPADDRAVEAGGGGGHLAAGRLVHEG